ncbi:L,D-transpeptidase [Nocardioides daejeonensis]|uniref:L,D-transpeptidase n=1 Tax=Nocardioides daejeonensis TaxID=1046556 RepID=UPI000D747718|nr:Ig-like domain-containing protein [Nocardioides daejeonensis]
MSFHHHRLRRSVALGVGLALVGTFAVGCQGDKSSDGASDPGHRDDSPAAAEPARVTVNVNKTKPVPVDRLVNVDVSGGTLAAVRLRSADGATIAGEVSDDGASWTAAERLEPGTSYVVTTEVRSTDGEQTTVRRRFTTVDLTLDQQVYPSVAPLEGETVGVGMPAIVTFDLPVTDRASIEKHLSVTSEPAQKGAWRWISDTEVHWRPASYWKPGTEVTIEADVNSVPAGDGRYGQESRTVHFTVGDSHVYRVNAQTHQMKVFTNGKLIRTFPITTGKSGFVTRSGTKVIMEKFRYRRMRSETVGIPAGSSESYDIDDVEYAMRVTYSGEFIHAAPWSVGSQGHANVSHGCTGMSTADAGFLYDMSRRGDVVEYTGTDRPMTLENGYGDWNLGFKDWKQGSALT